MSFRKVKRTVTGHETIDGAGIKLVRVLGVKTVQDFDPFLMLDSFDSKTPEEFVMGFPTHPHRGIETITYLLEGEIEHQDSLGNKGSIKSGESQWMTAGSGIMHQEMPLDRPWLLGLQIWLNLPRERKMAHPTYFDIKKDMIPKLDAPFGDVRVISGQYNGTCGLKPSYIQATLLDFAVNPGQEVVIPTISGETAFVFLILGGAFIHDKLYPEKTAVLFDGDGDSIQLKATDQQPLRFLFFQGKPLGEPVAWGGPIVMNTSAELQHAFQELENGSFIKHKPANHRA
ncbi:MAG: pirin family protein [Deltaproteobacteria bacterium]|jgi:redox-sensitive bicupin YhaK (pirin superfamily)|nr:pirin family protein [Deltaproteobacteria bacterium]